MGNKKKHKKMSQYIRWIIEVALFLVAIAIFFLSLNHFWMRPVNSDLSNSNLRGPLTQKKFNYVAIGDSLTEGVGDRTAQGGFVPLLAHNIDDTYDVQVKSQNFGVSGNTSTQIYKRVTTDNKIQKAIKNADLITITVGGNDVMKVIRTQLANLSETSFKAPAKAYQKQILDLFAYIRQINPDVQVYVVGIYNPFYLNFPDIKQMQDVIDNWNIATKAIVDKQKKMYFVPINDLLYQGLDGNEGVTEKTETSHTITNNALFEEDHFHPNNIGYQVMSDAVAKAYKEHANEK